MPKSKTQRRFQLWRVRDKEAGNGLSLSKGKSSTTHLFPTSVRTGPLRKTRIACKTLINKPKFTIWKNKLTSLSINFTSRQRKKLKLWRGRDNNHDDQASTSYSHCRAKWRRKINNRSIFAKRDASCNRVC